MNCEEVRSRLHPYCDGSLPEAEFRALEAHLSGCSSCRSARDRIRKLESLLEKAAHVPEPDPGFWGAQKDRILARAAQREPRRLWPVHVWAPLAAAAVLVLAVGFKLLLRREPAPIRPETPVVETPKRPFEKPRAPEPLAPPPGPSKAPAPIKEPSPAPPTPAPGPAAPESEPAVLMPPPVVASNLPGDPGHFERMTDETLAVGLADTASDRVGTFFRAADARLAELKIAVTKDESMAEELASAYALILREGVAVVLEDRDESAEEVTLARRIAKARAKRNEPALAELQTAVRGRLKDSLQDALRASREIAMK